MLRIVKNKESFELRMPATLAGIDEADDRLAAYVADCDLPVDVFALRILLREALLNAVTHGSGQDPAKEVELDLLVDCGGVTMIVRDYGPGFAWSSHCGGFDVTGDGGRGLALMELYSDKMSFNERANEVTLRKEFKAAPVTHGAAQPADEEQ